jgi:glycosyltransferase involved in cell wall biosynthesis
MRIAVTNHHRQLTGGTESYLAGILPELERAGHHVCLFHEAPLAPAAPSIPTQNHSMDFGTLRAFRPAVIFNHGLQSPATEHSLAHIAPVVHFAHNYHGTCISGEKTHKFPTPTPCQRTLGLPCLAHYFPHRCGGLNPLVMLREYGTQSARLGALRRVTAIVTASRHMQAEYLRHQLSPVHCVPLFVTPPELQHQGGQGLLFAGRMTAIKGARYLALAARDLDIGLTFAGDGPERASLQRLCPNARFPGWLAQHELRALALAHDVFVMPSLWPEPFGLAGLELGLPVAAFTVGGIPDWLTDGENGYLAPANPPTPAGLRLAILACLGNPALGPAALARAKEFTLARHFAALMPILESAAR